MSEKIKKLFASIIIVLFFPNLTATADERSDYDFPEQQRQSTRGLDDSYGSFMGDKLTRAREKVRMLDDVYKTFIVLITAEYVDDPSVLPAATLTKRVFESMSRKGWNKARLLDATGTPFNPDNNPRDKFERDAIKAMISGESYFEKVEKVDGKDSLRAATSVRAVMKGCIYCHPDKKVGDLLGAISYSIRIN
ncbi:MAG: DUF3365 domain-containing protein [Candidatus Scalindua rubra]|uniref:Tll0287-like domain-containing protein n=1 Tax=Candidatus Scalindua brodae TaxID=237368 RepID=A0A0B0EJW0_9BACT|nr:MAG: hypothetical protein SCABRO_03307 [Candidatus Scalindua brodae]MBZ0109146.1 DUF3365 domain-containing protein [Candidatus Scalindua rubra]TWU33583.1 hypothetical protein S225a_14730 [Candidatus Brocadiaceae bacterium S225]